jgi:acetate kinase
VNILVLNCGSSTVKFQLLEMAAGSAATDRDRKLATGLIDRFGEHALFRLKDADDTLRQEEKLAIPDHEAAVRLVIARLGVIGLSGAGDGRVDAVGHRVVHGGDFFTAATALDDRSLARLEMLNDLAPLHNPAALSGIRAARKVLGASVPMAAVFDTAFPKSFQRGTPSAATAFTAWLIIIPPCGTASWPEFTSGTLTS